MKRAAICSSPTNGPIRIRVVALVFEVEYEAKESQQAIRAMTSGQPQFTRIAAAPWFSFSNFSVSQKPPLCHLDRSEAEWRDLQF